MIRGSEKEVMNVQLTSAENLPVPHPANSRHLLLSIEVSAFTLIEMLLVVTMLGIVTLMSVPNLVKSIRANRLRTAARAVVASGKYARSMAVMRQQELRLVFHIDAGTIEVADAVGTVATAEGETEEREQPQRGRSMLSRTLNKVRIEYVDIENEGMTSEGSCSVAYRRNGRCTPYSVVLVDKRGTRQTVHVDALSTARTEE